MKKLYPSLFFLLLPLAASAASDWQLIETAKDNGRRLAPAPLAAQEPSKTVLPSLRCDDTKLLQEIEGFGGALTESSGWVLSQISPSARREVLTRYYDAKSGLGYTLARTHINSCDFSLKTWALDEVPGDVELKHFTLAPMRTWVLPLIHEARTIAGESSFRLLASPWSPPAWMKTNGKMADGGQLRPEYRDAWARYFVRFIKAMREEEKIPVWALTVQNEPEAKQVWESCLYNPEEERDFVKQHLGPTLAKAGLSDVRLLILDHNRDLMDARAKVVYGDKEAAKYVWGMAMHWYVSEDYAAASRVHALAPDKKILFTEGCVEGGAKPDLWDVGERYGRSIINDLNNWVCGWIDWNIVLDSKGGPNHVNNFCDAPVLVDVKTGEVSYQSSFFYIGHFSRFVKPGAHRIESGPSPEGLSTIAFKNPDGGLVVVVMNKQAQAQNFEIKVGGTSLRCEIPARAIQTYLRN